MLGGLVRMEDVLFRLEAGTAVAGFVLARAGELNTDAGRGRVESAGVQGGELEGEGLLFEGVGVDGIHVQGVDGHCGWSGGYRCFLGRIVELELEVIFVSNGGSCDWILEAFVSLAQRVVRLMLLFGGECRAAMELDRRFGGERSEPMMWIPGDKTKQNCLYRPPLLGL